MSIRIFFIIILGGLFSTSCNLVVEPSDSLTTGTLVTTSDGLRNALNGAYSLYKDHVEFNGVVSSNNMYLRQYFQLADFASDDIVCGQVTTDPLWYSFTQDHTPTQANTRFFWYISYKIINTVNTVIEAVEQQGGTDAATEQLLGECYFLRAFTHFNLVRLFAKPYTHDPNAPGVILRLALDEPAAKERATVAEVYQAIIADAERGASLMNNPRGAQYASKEAAWALLSRVYLYMENHEETIRYADQVINSGRFTLTTPSTYPSLFPNAVSASETIFCVAFTSVDDYGRGSIASMVYSDGNSGWGEEFASASLRALMEDHPEDVRWQYIEALKDESGQVRRLNGIPIYYIKKFSYQDGNPNLSSPIMFRLAELYLNRAEAKAKSNRAAEALDDLDIIRSNRGLAAHRYDGQPPAGLTALEAVWNERRIELAFEGHRMFDVYRNKQDLVRDYWGYHLVGLRESDIDHSRRPAGFANIRLDWQHPRSIYHIPIDEVLSNPLVTQNP
ncbi:RagB/SusD family nutrient uptake outer membrane protein [Parapedobacter sp. ISTM3]|uniref:SusD family protein n=1 Tax=Parapedobacter luteus TaxID=623280 RepID=A0A1T5CVY5_9SPHI|nr:MULTISPECIES: RagB/SusD family nutrient uptake outer membrane protein [Parapedobacter]MBK1440683.1 RagB/SusD family nutrient uptake outer membrane protein [Parapedobacter sp. ISTM3]SKB63599.1 SusD family protein [Parapedobacter luteus]